uniref:Uncharacterized protein n=1 Tax=Clytia hemisphaerica TaxID=252671 RepID=A0A7M6DRI8_9CNID
MAETKKVVYIFTSFTALTILIIACIGWPWMEVEFPVVTVKGGLWEICASQGNSTWSDCSRLHLSDGRFASKFKGTKACSIISIIIAFIGTILAHLSVTDHKISPAISGMVFLLAAVFAVAAACVYQSFFQSWEDVLNGVKVSVGWAFVMQWIGAVCVLFNAVYGCVLYRFA